jgi:hypothetical protein
MLPDEVLLAIFYSCLYGSLYQVEERQKAWRSLVHVYRRWRRIVFGSPRHLGLQLVCTARTRARDMLDVWPALPLFIRCTSPAEKVDNISAVLERTYRVCIINLSVRTDLEPQRTALPLALVLHQSNSALLLGARHIREHRTCLCIFTCGVPLPLKASRLLPRKLEPEPIGGVRSALKLEA